MECSDRQSLEIPEVSFIRLLLTSSNDVGIAIVLMAVIIWEIDDLNFLKAGGWQSLEEVIDGCSLPECKTRLVLKFLRQFNFIQVDEEKQKVKLHSNMLNFINQTVR